MLQTSISSRRTGVPHFAHSQPCLLASSFAIGLVVNKFSPSGRTTIKHHNPSGSAKRMVQNTFVPTTVRALGMFARASNGHAPAHSTYDVGCHACLGAKDACQGRVTVITCPDKGPRCLETPHGHWHPRRTECPLVPRPGIAPLPHQHESNARTWRDS